MVEKPKLLSVVTSQEGDTVYVHADLSGLKKLRTSIDSMISKLEVGECDHDHLRSEDWAGYELTTTMLEQEKAEGCNQVHHVKFYAWNTDWKNKHDL